MLTPGDLVVHAYSYSADGQQVALVKSDTRRMREMLEQQGIGHADVIPLRRPQ